jgi:hypothetical protein
MVHALDDAQGRGVRQGGKLMVCGNERKSASRLSRSRQRTRAGVVPVIQTVCQLEDG